MAHRLTVFGFFVVAAAAFAQEPEPVTLCDLKKDPPRFNHQLVKVTALVSHGFEDFGFFDPLCPGSQGVWLEYGGTIASGTIYCCGVTAGRTRPDPLVIDDIAIPLVADDNFRQFNRLIQLPPNRIVRATLVARFFAGTRQELPNDAIEWTGYGHFACCSLLAIQQVESVDPQNRSDLDYRSTPDEPKDRAGCGSRDFVPSDGRPYLLAAQKSAEDEKGGWPFSDPQRVATTSLAGFLNINPTSTSLKQTRKSEARIVYEWKPKASDKSYLVVVSRPYWLSFYAKDPKHIPWVTIAAYETSCR